MITQRLSVLCPAPLERLVDAEFRYDATSPCSGPFRLLGRMLELVPMGHEPGWLDLDGLIEELLDPSIP